MSKRKYNNSHSLQKEQPRKRQRTNNYECDSNAKNKLNNHIDYGKIDRPTTSSNFNSGQEITFQHIDTDYYIGFDPLKNGQNRTDDRDKKAIIRLYGVTALGESVCCHCVGFAPYFYCDTWPGFVADRDEEQLRQALNNRMLANESNLKTKCHTYITRVVSVNKQSIWGYHFGKSSLCLKIYTALPTVVPSARKIITEGLRISMQDSIFFQSQTYESNLVFILRYMIDSNIVGGGWISVSADKYALVDSQYRKSSNCSIEVVARCDNVSGIHDRQESMAPLRILSFDIECMCEDGFPEAKRKNDQVIQISNVCYVQGAEELKSGDNGENEQVYFHKSVFCLDTCAAIAGCEVYSFATEKELLFAWSKFLRRLDPDILTGYNIVNFDLPYLINRAEYLKVSNFAYLGREKNRRSIIKESSFSSRAYGSSKSANINISGRIQMDLLPIIRRDHKLRSYSLNSVSFHFLRAQKEDVEYSIIGTLQRSSADTRRRLAVYCLKDSLLVLQLIKKLQTTINLIEMARVTGVPINFLISRGQQIKVLSQLYRHARVRDLIIPYIPYSRDNKQKGGSDAIGYEGATVIEPKKGYYKEPIVTLDFASLYPSIMIAHNLCYTTMVDRSDLGRLSESDYTKTPNNDYFVKPHVQKGVLPEILQNLLSQRKKVKQLMKELRKQKGGKESMSYAVYNGRQLALKISANSVYGFTGATVGALPCLVISAAVTGFGRDMIHDTKEFIETHYHTANGFPCDATVVYGDTDSVMIKFGQLSDNVSMQLAMKYGLEAAHLVTEKLFIEPIMLEFEKVYCPYLLMNKKRYAGMLWTNCEKWDYMDAKGIETVRRDNCPLTKNLIQSVLDYVLIKGNAVSAVEYTKNVISQLLQNKIDLSSLIITKKLNKIEDYKVKVAHVELVKRMRKRKDQKLYKTGDRVSYVITKKGSKKAKAFEKAEDPLYALENGIAIDTDYYLKNQLEQPLTRIFEPILGENGVRKLFYGHHTRVIKVSTSNVGAMMSFVVKKRTCIGCKCLLQHHNSNSAVCNKCKKNESQLYMKQMAVVRKKEKEFHKLWTHCQRCQGSLTQPVLCSNRDCPIFYKRTKVRKDLQEAQKLLKEFSF